MERLTRKYNGGYGLVKVKDKEQEVDSPYPNTLKAILESFLQLGKYEDTNLTPAEINILKQEVEHWKNEAERWQNVSLLDNQEVIEKDEEINQLKQQLAEAMELLEVSDRITHCCSTCKFENTTVETDEKYGFVRVNNCPYIEECKNSIKVWQWKYADRYEKLKCEVDKNEINR